MPSELPAEYAPFSPDDACKVLRKLCEGRRPPRRETLERCLCQLLVSNYEPDEDCVHDFEELALAAVPTTRCPLAEAVEQLRSHGCSHYVVDLEPAAAFGTEIDPSSVAAHSRLGPGQLSRQVMPSTWKLADETSGWEPSSRPSANGESIEIIASMGRARASPKSQSK